VFKVNFKMVKVLLRIHNAIRFGGGFFVGFFRARIIGEFTQINPLGFFEITTQWYPKPA